MYVRAAPQNVPEQCLVVRIIFAQNFISVLEHFISFLRCVRRAQLSRTVVTRESYSDTLYIIHFSEPFKLK